MSTLLRGIYLWDIYTYIPLYIPIYLWDINLGVDLLGHKECLVGILDSFPYWQSVLPEILTAIPLNPRPFPLFYLSGAPPTSVHLLLGHAETRPLDYCWGSSYLSLQWARRGKGTDKIRLITWFLKIVPIIRHKHS